MELTSPVFTDGGSIPLLYTCEGKGCNPPLAISKVPQEAQSLVLIVDDPDVPEAVRKDRMWDHWVVYNIPPTTTVICENTIPPGIQGKNTNGQNQYYPPCPPDREHRYFFKLYALDRLLNLSIGATKKEVEKSMEGYVIAECKLMGRYNKKENSK